MHAELRNSIANVKAKKGAVITNCYSASLIDKASCCWSNQSATAFCYEDHGVNRIIYFAADADSLYEILLNTNINKPCALSFILRQNETPLGVFEKTGFKRLAIMKRFSTDNIAGSLNNPKINIYEGKYKSYSPSLSDVSNLNRLLWKTFDTRTSRLIYDNELAEYLKTAATSLYRDYTGVIRAFCILQIQPKKFYVHHYYNSAQSGVIHSMLLKHVRGYAAGGGKYAYCWIDEKNIPSIKCMEKYGMQPDGVCEYIYVK